MFAAVSQPLEHWPRTNHLAAFGAKNPHSISSEYTKDCVHLYIRSTQRVQLPISTICIYKGNSISAGDT